MTVTKYCLFSSVGRCRCRFCHLILFVSSTNYFQLLRRQCFQCMIFLSIIWLIDILKRYDNHRKLGSWLVWGSVEFPPTAAIPVVFISPSLSMKRVCTKFATTFFWVSALLNSVTWVPCQQHERMIQLGDLSTIDLEFLHPTQTLYESYRPTSCSPPTSALVILLLSFFSFFAPSVGPFSNFSTLVSTWVHYII